MTPVILSQADLEKALLSMATSVSRGDSFDGSIEYEFCDAGKYKVMASWRIGNSEGQGGCCTIGTFEQSAEQP